MQPFPFIFTKTPCGSAAAVRSSGYHRRCQRQKSWTHLGFSVTAVCVVLWLPIPSLRELTPARTQQTAQKKKCSTLMNRFFCPLLMFAQIIVFISSFPHVYTLLSEPKGHHGRVGWPSLHHPGHQDRLSEDPAHLWWPLCLGHERKYSALKKMCSTRVEVNCAENKVHQGCFLFGANLWWSWRQLRLAQHKGKSVSLGVTLKLITWNSKFGSVCDIFFDVSMLFPLLSWS